jgi:hypothetical protein
LIANFAFLDYDFTFEGGVMIKFLKIKLKLLRVSFVLISLGFLISCQSNSPLSDEDIQQLEQELKQKLVSYLGPNKNLESLSANHETVFMIDVDTGYAYSLGTGLVQLNK